MTEKKVNIQEALNEKPGFQVWWRLLRPHTLTAAFVPVFVGSMYALVVDEVFHIGLFLAMLLASLLIQAATNMFNEYYDFVRGLDHEGSVGIGGTIVRDGIAPKTILRLGFAFFGIAILLGVYICIATSWWIAVIGVFSMLVGYLYTAGPFPIAYTPFGEVASGLLMGTVIIGISYFIQTMTVTIEVIFISIPVAIFIGAIMLSNNIRDLDNDKINGRKTIAILLGKEKAVQFLQLMFTVAYILTIFYIGFGILPLLAVISLFSVMKAQQVIKAFNAGKTPIEMMPAMAATGKTNTMYGLLLGVSITSYLLYLKGDFSMKMDNTLMKSLGIEFVETNKDKVVMTMPVDERTHQPAGFLHGGASVLLAETAASIGGFLNINQEKQAVFGMEINANHIRSKQEGMVTATATPLHLGRTSMVWNITISDEQDKLVCTSRCTLGVVDRRN